MKYEVYMYRHDRKDVEIEADNRDDALRLALERNPGFKADSLIDQHGAESSALTTCENCEKTIWDEEKYWTDPDGVCLCNKCHEALESETNKEAK